MQNCKLPIRFDILLQQKLCKLENKFVKISYFKQNAQVPFQNKSQIVKHRDDFFFSLAPGQHPLTLLCLEIWLESKFKQRKKIIVQARVQVDFDLVLSKFTNTLF